MAKIGTAFQGTWMDTHLWVVISEPTSGGEVLCVNLTDSKNYPESTCHLAIGDHEFITKPSAIVYKSKGLKLWSVTALQNSIDSQMVRQYDDFKPEIIKRIIEGAFASDDMPPFRLALIKPFLVSN